MTSMFAPALRLAASKASSEAMRAALTTLVSKAEKFDAEEAGFPAEIVRHRAARGDSPPKLDKSTNQMLEGLARDQEETLAQMMVALGQESRAESIVWSLAFALRGDVQNGEGLLKFYPEADKPLGARQQKRKRELLDALDGFLALYPNDDEP
jgi:hypothetical protein